jgi:D-amino-acid dehydrogenase
MSDARPVPPDGPVVVIGGGIVGLSCAWFLRDAGAEVVVLEAGDRVGGGASRGNAGAICPSFAEPLAAPGALREVLAELRNPDAALHVHAATMPRMASFLARFARAASEANYELGVQALGRLGAGVFGAYDRLAEAGIGRHARRDGYLIPHRTQAAAIAGRAHLAHRAELGFATAPGELLDAAAIHELEPLLSDEITAGFVLPEERWIDAGLLVDELAEALIAGGADLRQNAAATDVVDLGDSVEVATAEGVVDGAMAVVAAGVWSRELVAPLGARLSLYPGKGYSFSVRPERLPERVIDLSGAHVMLTPLGDRLRVAGTMEFDGTTDRFNPGRIASIVRMAAPLLRGVDLQDRAEEWVGARPITPDGLPVIGAVRGHPRVVLATGHNMLGVTLGPITGEVVARLVCAGDAGIDLTPFAPERFGRR